MISNVELPFVVYALKEVFTLLVFIQKAVLAVDDFVFIFRLLLPSLGTGLRRFRIEYMSPNQLSLAYCLGG